MKNEVLPEAQFLRDIEQHEMHVLRDDGVYRHIRFKRPDSGCMHFDLVTWPGYLAYSGDMGCYVFSRLHDMFEFFRTDRKYRRVDGLAINPGYWSEKLQAVDGNRHAAGATEFSAEKFVQVINEYRIGWIREYGLNKAQRRELWEAVRDKVLDRVEDDLNGGHVPINAAYEFYERIGGQDFQFQDLFEHNFTQYTHRFIWCCYALAWSIQLYDSANEPVVEAAR